MQKSILTIIIVFSSLFVRAQWTTNGSGDAINNNSSGKVGIGTTLPAAKLDVGAFIPSGTLGTVFGRLSEGNSTGAGTFLGVRGYDTQPTNAKSFAIEHSFYGAVNNSINFNRGGSSTGGSISFNTNDNTEKMRITQDGYVGIGTNTPQTKLDLGDIRFDVISSFPAEGSILEGKFGNYIIGDVNSLQRLRLGVSNDGYTRSEIFLDNSNRPDGTISLKTASVGGGAQTRLFVRGDGNVGINDSDPWEKFQVDGSVGIGKFSNTQHAGLRIEYTDGGSGTTVFKHQRWGGDFYFKRNDASGERTQLYFGGAGNHYMDIYNNNNQVNIRLNTSGDSFFNGGNVGIGTGAAVLDAMLAVKGQVHAREVKVDLNGAVGPDYVFEKNYKLSSLEEIKNYIDQNKHLPEVPSAKEMEKNGVQLGEMNMLLLKKIEELTLYAIEMNRKMEKLTMENQKLKEHDDSIKLLQSELDKFKNKNK